MTCTASNSSEAESCDVRGKRAEKEGSWGRGMRRVLPGWIRIRCGVSLVLCSGKHCREHLNAETPFPAPYDNSAGNIGDEEANT